MKNIFNLSLFDLGREKRIVQRDRSFYLLYLYTHGLFIVFMRGLIVKRVDVLVRKSANLLSQWSLVILFLKLGRNVIGLLPEYVQLKPIV